MGRPDDTAGAASASGATDLDVRNDMLQDFVDKVDAALRKLEGSAGNPTKVSAQTIKQTSLSSGSHSFGAAEGLYKEYNRVHRELTDLSRTLHLQIEAIGIAVLGAKHGFEGLEEEQRQRFWQIQTQIRQIQSAKDGGQHTGTGDSGSL
ncbi:hypothetical protein [Streptomyces sp. NBC_00076]|uniref:hypothetical protein n=1 Tax=Streptomyces sp. NBC_00076 TaxID=2975642 RepID=UPI003255C030